MLIKNDQNDRELTISTKSCEQSWRKTQYIFQSRCAIFRFQLSVLLGEGDISAPCLHIYKDGSQGQLWKSYYSQGLRETSLLEENRKFLEKTEDFQEFSVKISGKLRKN